MKRPGLAAGLFFVTMILWQSLNSVVRTQHEKLVKKRSDLWALS